MAEASVSLVAKGSSNVVKTWTGMIRPPLIVSLAKAERDLRGSGRLPTGAKSDGTAQSLASPTGCLPLGRSAARQRVGARSLRVSVNGDGFAEVRSMRTL